MNRGIYTSASGMVSETVRTDTIANNLANCNTVGYKKDINITKDFQSMLIERINDGEDPPPKIGNMGTGSVAIENYVVHRAGSFIDTGNPLDVAINGKGYFSVETPNGVRYTRNGSFVLNPNMELTTVDGYPVQGVGGARIILLNADAIRISQDGNVYNGDQLIGQLNIVDFGETRALHKEGQLMFRADEGANLQQSTGKVVQGMLEASNVNVIEEMVNLIASYRAFEINAKGVQTHDQLNDKAVNEVSRV